MQLAETEAFSLNSDKSSSILLGDDLSLEGPTACPLGPKDSRVSGPVGPLPGRPGHCCFPVHHLRCTCCVVGPHLWWVR